MNRNVVFVVLFVFVLSGISTDAPDTKVAINFERPDYVLSETEMPIYELITPPVNATYTESMAYSLFNIRDTLAEEKDGIFFVNSGNKSFEIDAKDGSMWYGNYDLLWNIELGNDIPTPAICNRSAYDWLITKGILPENTKFASIGSTNATAYIINDDRAISKILQYNINYKFHIGDYPIAGEAAQITVMIGEGGERVGFDWKWREPKSEPYTKAALIEYDSILEVNGISPSDVINHRLVYTTDGDDGVSFTSNHDDHSLGFTQLRLGDGDLDTIVFDACSPLAWENDVGDTVFERWAPSLQGVHQICSFATGSHNAYERGTKFAAYMTGFGIVPGMTIVNAWFRATLETEPSDILAAVFYGSKSTNPLNPQLDDPINDHAYGFGYVCSDPIPGSFGYYVYITSSC